MNIRIFYEIYGGASRGNIKDVVNRWAQEQELDGLLHSSVGAGVVLGDLMVGDRLIDQISPELASAFSELMGDKADSFDKVRHILLEKLERGDESVLGLVNKIKGQVGENRFVEEIAASSVQARLAGSGSQEGWDVAVEHEWGTQYVQVKMYSDADGVLAHIEAVQEKLASERPILDGDAVVEKIDFAVPSEISEEVARKAAEKGLDVTVLPIDMTASDAASVVMDGLNNVGPEALENFFSELLGIGASSMVLHGLVSAFLLYKGARERHEVLAETGTSVTFTLGGAAAGGLVQILATTAGVVGAPVTILTFLTAIGTRGILQRLSDRSDYVEFLRNETLATRELTTQLC